MEGEKPRAWLVSSRFQTTAGAWRSTVPEQSKPGEPGVKSKSEVGSGVLTDSSETSAKLAWAVEFWRKVVESSADTTLEDLALGLADRLQLTADSHHDVYYLNAVENAFGSARWCGGLCHVRGCRDEARTGAEACGLSSKGASAMSR
jgi:hypothetical protein